MKIAATIAKILAAVATIAGAVYLIATYGDKIVAWAKKILGCTCCRLNPSGSVFCAKGSGFIVPWDEVDDYMHCKVKKIATPYEK